MDVQWLLLHDDPWIDVVVAGRYRIIRKLGEGGMSAVYEARHVKLHRQFAVKRLLDSLLDNEDAMSRFEREAEMLAGLRHPNVVEVTDWDQFPDGTPCMVLEYLHGATLTMRLARGPMPWDAIARIGDQVMSALTLAHRNGITHRDLKPDNIFIAIDDVGDERVKLLDFGISKLRGVAQTTGMQMLGTPAYMSPEQAHGDTESVGPSTDAWAMGAILYEMATGRSAFGSDQLADTLRRIVEGKRDPIPALRADAPPAFIEVVDRALSLDPERRTQTIEELRAGLRQALAPRDPYRVNTPVAGSRLVASDGTPTPMPTPLPSAMRPVLPGTPFPAPPVQVVRHRGLPWYAIAALVVILVAIGTIVIVVVT